MTLTRKHFIAIAYILREQKANDSLIKAFCGYLSKDNDLFDKLRFIKASGGEVKE